MIRMLFVFTGSDLESINAKSRGLIDGLQKKQPEAELIELNPLATEESILSELKSLSSSQGLFFQKSIVRIPQLFPNKDLEKSFKTLVKTVHQSPSIFVWVEPDLSKGWETLLKKLEVKIDESGKKISGPDKFNVFSITDAVIARDKQRVWRLLRQAQDAEVEVEPLFGACWWQAKSLLLVKSSNSVDESGVKPYVYNKLKNNNWTLGQARKLVSDLVGVQARSKAAGKPFSLWVELEAWALTL